MLILHNPQHCGELADDWWSVALPTRRHIYSSYPTINALLPTWVRYWALKSAYGYVFNTQDAYSWHIYSGILSWYNIMITTHHIKLLSEWINYSSQWRHNGRGDGVSNHRCIDCLLSRLLRRKSKKTSKLRVTGLCEGDPPVIGGFRPQRAS